MYPEKTTILKDICILVFSAALFTVARTSRPGSNLDVPSTDEWIKKLWHIYTVEYFSAIKRNKFESVIVRWMNPEPIIQSEVTQKNKYCIFTHICGII